MNLLDMRTILFGYLMTITVCLWFVVQIWRQNRNRYAGTAYWVVDYAFQAVAIVLVVIRGAVPDWISMVLSNTLVVSGAILGFVGQERFLGKKGPQIQHWLLVPLFILVHCHYAFVQPNLSARNINLAAALLLVCGQSVWLMWRRVGPALRSVTFGVGVVNFLYCLLSGVRIAHCIVAPHLTNDYFHPALFEALVLLGYQALFILLTYGFILMVNGRLILEIGAQQEKFSKAFRSAPYAITLTRPDDGRIVEVNESFSTISGYDRTEVLEKSTIDLNLWENEADRAAVLDTLSRTGSVRGREMRFRNKSGEALTGLFSAEVILIDGEKTILSSINDITDRKRTEAALQRAHDELEERVAERTKQLESTRQELDIILEHCPLAISKIVDRRQVWINRMAAEMFRYPKEELEFQTTQKLYPSEEAYEKLGREAYPRLAQGVIYETEQELVRKDGVHILVRHIGKAVEPTDLSKGTIWLLEEVTDRKRAEEALRESEERFRTIFTTAYQGIVITSPSFAFEKANPAFCRMMGYSEAELRSMTFADITHPDYLEKDMENVKKLGKGQIPFYQTEKRYIDRRGNILWGELIASGIRDENGALRYYLSLVTDITERKRAEEERKGLEERLLRAEKMEALGTLAGGVAHDLNNMLGALIGHAELLKWDLKKTDPLYDAAENICTSGQAAAAVVQDLLTMARRGVILKEPASLNRIVAERIASSEIRKLLDAHPHVALKTQYDPDLLEVNLSAIHIERVVTNLISNALHSLQGAEGTVTIRTENRYLEAPWTGYETIPKGEYALLCLSDTGIGISPEHMKNLFEPYFMRKTLRKGGSGLGLSVIWGAVKDHDGYIDVASTPGRGSAFTLYFPVTRDGAAGRVGHPADPYRGRGERILVVDDEEAQCRVAVKILTRLNYAVKSVESGEEALGYLADHDVDLIVLDMIMAPGIDGYETYRRVLEIKPRQKAILFSGFSKTERVKMAQELGAGEFIMKPYLIERLGIAVKRELERR